MKRKDIMLKNSDTINPEYSYMKLLPSSSISNYDSAELSLLVNELFKTLLERIHFIENRFFLEKRTSIRYMIDISKTSVEFFYVIPSAYKDLAIDTIAKMWNGRCTVQEINKNSIRVLEDPTIYQLKYKYEDSLSMKTDKKSNKFLHNALSVIEIMGARDNVQLAVNLIPYQRKSSSWKTYCDDIYDRYKKNLPVHKNKIDFTYLMELLFASVGELINLILPESLRTSVDFSIAGDKRELSQSSIKKAKDAKKIVDTQMAVLTKSEDKEFEDTLAKSFCGAFKSIKEDNELLGYKTNFKKSEVSIHNHRWNIDVNRLCADELSNIITIAGQAILKQFKNIEHVAIKQVQLIPELAEGIAVLGTQTYKNSTQVQYLNEYKAYAILPILILTKMGGGKSTWFETVGVSLMNNFRRKMREGKPAKKESILCLDFIKQNELSYNIMNNMDPEDIELIDLSTPEGTAKLGFFFKEAEIDYDDPKKRIRTASRQSNEMMKLINYLNNDTSKPLTTPMQRYLNSAFMICYIHENKSLRDAMRIIENYDVRHEYIDMVPDELKESLDDEIRALLELDDPDEGTKQKLVSGIIARTYTLQSDPILKEMYKATPDTGVNFIDAMQEGKGIFILMPDDEFDCNSINIVSTYVIARLFFACKKRGKMNPNKLTRCTLLIDEINLAPGCLTTLNDIIGQLRKYVLRPIISAHNLQQIKELRANLTSVGLSVILPQGSWEQNFLEFEHQFNKEGFTLDDLHTLREYETLNLMETSQGKKAFISKFPKPVPGKIELREDMSITEFKQMITDRVNEANKKKVANSKPKNTTINPKPSSQNKEPLVKKNSVQKNLNLLSNKEDIKEDNSRKDEVIKEIALINVEKEEQTTFNKEQDRDILILDSNSYTVLDCNKKDESIGNPEELKDLNSSEFDEMFESMELDDDDEDDFY